MTETRPSKIHALSSVTAACAVAGAVYSGFGYTYGVALRGTDPVYALKLEETFLTPTVACVIVAILSTALALSTRPKV